MDFFLQGVEALTLWTIDLCSGHKWGDVQIECCHLDHTWMSIFVTDCVQIDHILLAIPQWQIIIVDEIANLKSINCANIYENMDWFIVNCCKVISQNKKNVAAFSGPYLMPLNGKFDIDSDLMLSVITAPVETFTAYQVYANIVQHPIRTLIT